ncbi:SIS domain-containing protein [Metabacillus sp. KIGAM252]|uniref:SIS domain-containing protein n=1 Tax=Metabacillus flavus TaxID=2823519 RepID=A0ABS5LGV0_9BACI|nr:SIS domain-containing protein [Metabacillus flavus]MBS2969824.1 SIS domain-containing protein [Metabacillus flavus]
MESFTLNEINDQGTIIEKTFFAVDNLSFEALNPGTILLFTGCGTSYYLAHSAAKYYQKITGRPAAAVPASELILCPDEVLAKDAVYRIAVISRSGTTSEAVEAVNKVRDRKNVSVMAVTCNEDSPLCISCDEAIVLSHVNEKSVVMTQSFSAMLYALQLYAAHNANDPAAWNELKALPGKMKEALNLSEKVKNFSESIEWENVIYLGSGIYNGIAKEATLKLKEMTQTVCESYCSLEFRHGPISIAGNKTAVILIGSSSTLKYDLPLLEDCRKLGAEVYYLGPVLSSEDREKVTESFVLPNGAADHHLVLAMPYVQKIAYYRACLLGLNPDLPKNLTQVVHIPI